jgi:serine/alanine adding enzyme
MLGTVRHLFIKREIPMPLFDELHYEIVTPYGYGGPLILNCLSGEEQKLVAEFEEAFQKYCTNNRIVNEFIRFHPIFGNAKDFEKCYNINFKRKTIQTNLKDYDDPILSEYSASCRRDIRHALKAGVEYRIILNPSSLDDFREIYHSTMKRNDADSIYYFDDDYFSKCLEFFGENIIVVEVWYKEQVIGMSLNFIYDKFIHAHLTGTLQEFHHLAPAYVQQYALALWGKENGMDLIHHGGGRTGEVDDKLYLFKKKFGRNKEFDYYTGTRIWNDEAYAKVKESAAFFSDIDQKA